MCDSSKIPVNNVKENLLKIFWLRLKKLTKFLPLLFPSNEYKYPFNDPAISCSKCQFGLSSKREISPPPPSTKKPAGVRCYRIFVNDPTFNTISVEFFRLQRENGTPASRRFRSAKIWFNVGDKVAKIKTSDITNRESFSFRSRLIA